MGRKRNKADQWMPPRVYQGKAAFEWHPISGGAVRLCDLDSTKSNVWKRYEQEEARYNATSDSFKQLSAEYQTSPQFKKLSIRTQKDYTGYSEKLNKVFGKMDADSIKPAHIRKYLDIRGQKSETQANREFSYMSTAYSWGFERGKTAVNPCKGVKKFSEKARDRYITDNEYQAVYAAASIPLKIAMELSYLCAARSADVLSLTRTQLLKEGIFIKQGKTGKEQIKGWTDRLRTAVKLSKSCSKIESFYIVHKENGDKYTYSGIASAWTRARKKAKVSGFTFHDIKAKSISDYEGDKQKFSGHKTASQVAIYDRKTPIVEALNLPNISDIIKGK